MTRIRTAAGTIHSVRRVIPGGAGTFDGRPLDLPVLSCGARLPAAYGPADDDAIVTCKRCAPRTAIDDVTMSTAPSRILLADSQVLLAGVTLVAHLPSNWDAQISACGKPVASVATRGRDATPCPICKRSLPQS